MEKIEYAKVWRNGQSLVVTIPQPQAKKLNLKEGNRVHITVEVV